MPERPTVEPGTLDALDVRVGTVVEARAFPAADRPLLRLLVDFGPEVGRLRSAAGLEPRYEPGELVGRQVLAVVNLPALRIADFDSECLTLGVPDAGGEPVLVVPDRSVPDGGRLY